MWVRAKGGAVVEILGFGLLGLGIRVLLRFWDSGLQIFQVALRA